MLDSRAEAAGGWGAIADSAADAHDAILPVESGGS